MLLMFVTTACDVTYNQRKRFVCQKLSWRHLGPCWWFSRRYQCSFIEHCTDTDGRKFRADV